MLEHYQNTMLLKSTENFAQFLALSVLSFPRRQLDMQFAQRKSHANIIRGRRENAEQCTTSATLPG